MDTLFQNYYTAISIIIVYHLFSLQHWLDRVSALESTAEEVRHTTGLADIARERMTIRCKNMLKQFPTVQILLLFIGVTVLCCLSILAACNLSGVPYIYSTVPTVVLWLIFVVATFATWRQGRRMLTETIVRLD
jgi:hypothetical protein